MSINIHRDQKTYTVLTGEAAVIMKDDPEISNIIKTKTSYFVTDNKVIEKKDKETITSKKIDHWTNNRESCKSLP